MRGRAGFFNLDERLKALSAKGDAPERLSAVDAFELFRAALACSVPRWDGAKGRDAAWLEERLGPAVSAQGIAPSSTRRPALRKRSTVDAVCPAHGIGAVLAMPQADTPIHLEEISRTVRRRA